MKAQAKALRLCYQHYLLLGGVFLTANVALRYGMDLADRIEISDYWVRVATGSLLAAILIFQWGFHFLRPRLSGHRLKSWLRWHKYLGAAIPLALLVHAPAPGYGLLWLFSAALLANVAIGLFNVEVLKTGHPYWYRLWIGVHVLLSALLPFLLAVHVYQVIWYHSPLANW